MFLDLQPNRHFVNLNIVRLVLLGSRFRFCNAGALDQIRCVLVQTGLTDEYAPDFEFAAGRLESNDRYTIDHDADADPVFGDDSRVWIGFTVLQIFIGKRPQKWLQ